MPWDPIPKLTSSSIAPNMLDYAATCAAFSWKRERDGFLGASRPAGFNIADLAVDCHADGPLAGKPAIRWIAYSGATRDISFAELRELSNRFANVLRTLGVRKGESVFALTGRIPEHHVAALGTFKNQSVFCPYVMTRAAAR